MVMRARGDREENGDGGGETVILELGELKSQTRRRHLWSFFFSIFSSFFGGSCGKRRQKAKDERS